MPVSSSGLRLTLSDWILLGAGALTLGVTASAVLQGGGLPQAPDFRAALDGPTLQLRASMNAPAATPGIMPQTVRLSGLADASAGPLVSSGAP
ncbi:hypothetical protein [Jannaschia sp. M317]|uniref:hypothetical protein n=1 Tax=Jannaschia sp. M317 TaxID=2867011 RepID=UPI0021A498B7|nr:hypothetical protein [Jannaschia sp. M317]UWQ18863.1 hypothetical protein K3551_06155 [Jannaschia sp. M317]